MYSMVVYCCTIIALIINVINFISSFLSGTAENGILPGQGALATQYLSQIIMGYMQNNMHNGIT